MCDRSRNEVRWSHSIEKRAGKAGTILLRARRQAFRRNAGNSMLKTARRICQEQEFYPKSPLWTTSREPSFQLLGFSPFYAHKNVL